MLRFTLIAIAVASMAFTNNTKVIHLPTDELVIKKTTDFDISGNGSAKNWAVTQWITIPQRNLTGADYETKAKVLYSETGMYFLFSCEDKKLTNTMQADFLHLWDEDVIEFFLQPDSTRPVYLEYEISPLNYELPIIIYNDKKQFTSWMPFNYGGSFKTKHATTVTGGEKKSNASVNGWTTEIFVPYVLLRPVSDQIPAAGTKWKGNLYRIDYDKGQALWSWQLTSGNFHEYKKFGTLRFE